MHLRGGLFSDSSEGLEPALATQATVGASYHPNLVYLPTSESERRSWGRVTAGYFLPHCLSSATGFDDRKR
jgi:hypothetical protein